MVKAVGFTATKSSIPVGANTILKVSTSNGVINKAVTLGSASIGSIIKKRAFTPWGIALTTAVVAAGYYLDSQNQEILLDQGTAATYTIYGRCEWVGDAVSPKNLWPSPHGSWYTWTFTQCYDYLSTAQAGNWDHVVTGVNNFLFRDEFNSNRGVWYVHSTDQSTFTGVQSDYLDTAPTTATDEQIADAVQPYISDSTLESAFYDPYTDLVDETIPEVAQALADIQADQDLLNDADPTNDPLDPDTELNYDEETVKALNDIAETLADIQENLDDDECLQNPDLISCQEVGQLPASEPTVQEYSIPFDVTQYAFTSSAQCPADNIKTLSSGASITFSYQSYCDYAAMMNPIVIAAGLLGSILIVSGAVRG